MFIVIIALGTTDLLFALDSIPAIYGLTREPYLVLTANIFALMGLRQLYFLIGGLLQKLVYLSYGLSVLLGFIGVKLILHAMHENELPFLNGGEHIEWAPEIPILVSLGAIVGDPGDHHGRQPDRLQERSRQGQPAGRGLRQQRRRGDRHLRSRRPHSGRGVGPRMSAAGAGRAGA